MKKHITLLLLLSLSLSFGQVVITPGSGAPPPQLTRTGDTLLLQGSQPIDLSDLGGTPLVQELASTKTLAKEEAWIVYRNRSTSSEEFTYTIPNQANGGFTENIGYTFYVKDNGKIFIKGESGSGVEPVEISGAGQYATIIRVGENSWDWSKGVLPWEWNKYQVANAISVDNEANAITGITDIPEWKASSVSTGPTPYDGLYCIVFTHGGPDNTTYSSYIPLELEIGATYKVSISVQKVTDSSFSLYMNTAQGWSVNTDLAIIDSSVNMGEWYHFEAIGTPNITTPSIRIYAGSTSDAGNKLAIDKLIIEKQ